MRLLRPNGFSRYPRKCVMGDTNQCKMVVTHDRNELLASCKRISVSAIHQWVFSNQLYEGQRCFAGRRMAWPYHLTDGQRQDAGSCLVRSLGALLGMCWWRLATFDPQSLQSNSCPRQNKMEKTGDNSWPYALLARRLAVVVVIHQWQLQESEVNKPGKMPSRGLMLKTEVKVKLLILQTYPSLLLQG